MALIGVGATEWASGSHVWNGKTAILTRNPINNEMNIAAIMAGGMTLTFSGNSISVKVPVYEYSARIPKSIESAPAWVKIKYLNPISNLFSDSPQNAIRKYEGININSQNK